MRLSSKLILSLAAVALASTCWLIEQTTAQPLATPLGDDKKACLAIASSSLDTVLISPKVLKIQQWLRELNPQLEHVSLNTLIDSDGAELDIHRAGYVVMDSPEEDLMVQECAQFVDAVMDKIGSTPCGVQMVDLIQAKNEYYPEVMDSFSKIEQMVGFEKACLVTL